MRASSTCCAAGWFAGWFDGTTKHRGQVPKWPKGADCKSAGLCLPRFESLPAHHTELARPRANHMILGDGIKTASLLKSLLVAASSKVGKPDARPKEFGVMNV